MVERVQDKPPYMHGSYIHLYIEVKKTILNCHKMPHTVDIHHRQMIRG